MNSYLNIILWGVIAVAGIALVYSVYRFIALRSSRVRKNYPERLKKLEEWIKSKSSHVSPKALGEWLFKKYGPLIFKGRDFFILAGFVLFALLVVLVLLLAGIVLKIAVAIIVSSAKFLHGVYVGGKTDSTAVACVIIGLAVCYWFFRPSKDAGNKTNADKRKHVWFALGWTVLVLAANFGLWKLDSEWWLELRRFKDDSALFWFVMVLVVVSMWMMVNLKGSFKVLGFLALVIALSSWGRVVFSPYRILRADRWATYEIPFGKRIRIKTEYGIPFSYFTDDGPVPHRSGPNGELTKVTGNFDKLSIKPDRDMKASVEFVDNGS
jgi:hypothetical protein